MNLEKLKETARRFEQKEEWKKAIDVYLKAIAEVESGRDPHPDLAVYNRLGDLYLKTSENNAAIRAYERAAELYAEQGFFNNAIALCGKILRLNPQRSPVYLRLAALHARKNVVIEAKRNLLAYMERMHAAGQLDEAFAAVRQSADEFSGNQELRLMLVDLLKAASREDEAQDELRKVAAVFEARGDATAAAGLRSGLVEIDVDYSASTGASAPQSEAPASVPVTPAPAPAPASKNSDLVFLDVEAGDYDTEDAPEESAPPVVAKAPGGPLADLPLILGEPLEDDQPQPSIEAGVLPTGLTAPNIPLDGRSVIETALDGMDVMRVEGLEGTHAELDTAAVPPASAVEGFEVLAAFDAAAPTAPALEGVERHDTFASVDASASAVEGLEVIEGLAGAAPPTATPDAGALDLAESVVPDVVDEAPEVAASVADDEVPGLAVELSDEADAAASDDEPVFDVELDIESIDTDEPLVEDDADVQLADEPSAESDEAPATEAEDAVEWTADSEPTDGAEDDAAPEVDAADVQLDDAESADASPALGLDLAAEGEPLEALDSASPELGVEREPDPSVEIAEGATDETLEVETVLEVRSETSDESDDETVELLDDAVVLDIEMLPAEDASADEVAEAEMPLAALEDDVPAPASLEPAAVAGTLRTLIESLESQIADRPDDAVLHHRLADALLDAGEADRALEELAHALLGYEAIGEFDLAWSLADRLVAMQPDTIRFHQKRVEIAFRLEDRPRLIEAYLALGDGLIRANAVEKALAVYRRVLDHDPANREAHGALEAYSPRPSPAPPAVTPPTLVAPTPPQGPVLTSAVADDGFIDLGAMILEPEPERDTRMTTAIQPPTGDEDRDFEEALAAFKRGIEANLADTDYEAHYDLGIAFKEMGLLDEAIAEFQKALRAPDGRLRTSEALGQAFLEKGQTAIAEAVLRRAVESLEGGDDVKVGVLYWLGRSAELQGRTKEAVAAYERALAVDIRFADVSERLARLGAGRSS